MNKKIGAAIAGFLVLVIFFTWKSEKEKAIIGKWTADKLTECDVVVPIVTSLVDIEFKPNGKYIFNSTLNVHEEGNYKIKNDYLYTKDKIKENAGEKIVLIKYLKNDTLILEMNYKGKEQLLTLVKEKNEPDSKSVANIDNKQETSKVATQATNLGVTAAGALASDPKSQENSKVEEKKEDIVASSPNIEKQVEKEEKKTNSKLEAYKLREAKRKERDAEIKRKEKEIYDAYMARVAKRKQEAAESKKNKKK